MYMCEVSKMIMDNSKVWPHEEHRKNSWFAIFHGSSSFGRTKKGEKHYQKRASTRGENNVIHTERNGKRRRERRNEALYRSLILYITLEDETRERDTRMCNWIACIHTHRYSLSHIHLLLCTYMCIRSYRARARVR